MKDYSIRNDAYELIIDNYRNGNITDAKAQIKALSKAKRKDLYLYVSFMCTEEMKQFFFNQI